MRTYLALQMRNVSSKDALASVHGACGDQDTAEIPLPFGRTGTGAPVAAFRRPKALQTKGWVGRA